MFPLVEWDGELATSLLTSDIELSSRFFEETANKTCLCRSRSRSVVSGLSTSKKLSLSLSVASESHLCFFMLGRPCGGWRAEVDGIAGGHTNMADVGHFRGMVRDSMLPREFSAEGPTSCEAEEQAAR